MLYDSINIIVLRLFQITQDVHASWFYQYYSSKPTPPLNYSNGSIISWHVKSMNIIGTHTLNSATDRSFHAYQIHKYITGTHLKTFIISWQVNIRNTPLNTVTDRLFHYISNSYKYWRHTSPNSATNRSFHGMSNP